MNKVPEKYIIADAKIKKLEVKKLLALLYLIVSPIEITAHIIKRI
jgi:hypothetical protein